MDKTTEQAQVNRIADLPVDAERATEVKGGGGGVVVPDVRKRGETPLDY